jgi:hypothetical protein
MKKQESTTKGEKPLDCQKKKRALLSQGRTYVKGGTLECVCGDTPESRRTHLSEGGHLSVCGGDKPESGRTHLSGGGHLSQQRVHLSVYVGDTPEWGTHT